MPSAVTRGVRVDVVSEFLPERSDGETWFFAYHITISNEGSETVQLVSREWVITDSNGDVETVRGAGVVGEFPILEPGGSYEYTSFCPLRTQVGAMEGTYTMRTRAGETFEADIPAFTLAVPGSVN